ncbi:hypothetical protein BAUCODRAFT_124379 [Baudoinia panamericana UAMH 10762]|uniref:ER transporter 6TM N-terminal domain-containing protein n=1 Tax=Baudoinia panamericana (strain UAMH 10762) TaxID=717646 RepID=M2N7K0_BAUPA|nr:uncharacterized protein BAUCODRAFT_124379 [Baudoinia panamericana UAMH 10762]EMC94785.1 hypothetical protein BAUCODRAFT_124379 [Baudoinia panamericana UAMH 10762]
MQAQASSQSASSSADDAEKTTPKPKDVPDQPSRSSAPAEDGKKASKAKQLWDKVGLDFMTVSLMFKGSLPPTIALAAFQSTTWANHFGTLGYLVAIASVLGFCIMPRGKFIQTMLLNVFTVCLAAAVNLLALYCATQARLHTTPNGRPLAAYNSSSSAVLAIWLVFQTYVVNVVKASRPQFQFPAIIYSIFINVSMTNGVQFPTMLSAISFMKSLLEAFLTGFALATGVHFFVFPTSSRTVVFKEMTGYLMCYAGVLKAHTAAMHSLEEADPGRMRREREEAQGNNEHIKKRQKKDGQHAGPLTTPATIGVKEAFGKLIDLHTKLHADVMPAKREFAIGKLESHDLTELWGLLRRIFVPVMGLTASVDLLQRTAIKYHWSEESDNEQEEKARHRHIDSMHFLMKQLHEPFARTTKAIEAAMMHVLITLELVKPPKKKPDEESAGEQPVPGSPGFASAYQKKVEEFYHSKKLTLKEWCQEHDIELPADFMESTFVAPEKHFIRDEHKRERYQRQLFFTLYLEYLLYRTGCAVLDLVLWADKRKQEGALKHLKLIFPGSKTLYEWFRAIFGREDRNNDGHYLEEMNSGGVEAVDLGEEFERRKDPEHLPPQNALERFGETLRKIPIFLRSDASAFGFRVACATLTVGIICYLEKTQAWFLRQRLLWAMVIVAISMSRTSGQSTFNYALRALGTAIAMVGTYIIWYIVVGHAPGVLIFLWLWTGLAFYFILKFPKFIVVSILSLVTAVLIIGYELQVQKIGVAASLSSGQPVYPTYVLAPYRLATILGGLFVAFFWTIFPYPVSETSEMRKDLGAALYLLANFYSVVRETLTSRIRGTDGDVKVKGTHAYQLNEAFDTVVSKLLSLLTNLRTNAAFSKFQVRIGGRFPIEEYEGLIETCQHMLQHLALINYASTEFSLHNSHHKDGAAPSQWSTDFRKLLAATNTTSHQITSVLSLLSSALTNGQPLPPYLQMPESYKLVKHLDNINPDLLSVRHIAEPEYSAFAVLQVCAQAINDDFDQLARHVKALVGTIDFTFHSKEQSDADNDAAGTGKGKAD